MAEIRLEGIVKRFGADRRKNTQTVIEGLNLVIPNGKTTVLLGSSGCGKTTLLRLVAGLDVVDGGKITFDGKDASLIPIKERKIGIVFQNYALYPGFSARRNILSRFILGGSEKEDSALLKERLRETSERLGVSIEALLDRKPGALSGGERQRVAIGRCITRDPSLFLMDEPLSNLDAHLREKYRGELKRLLKLYSITTVYVTHDQTEAQFLSDKVALMRNGQIVQEGTYQEIYNDPVDLFTAEFLSIWPEVPALIKLPGELLGRANIGKIAGIRPDGFELVTSPAVNALEALVVIAKVNPQARSTTLHVEIAGHEASLILDSGNTLKQGDKILISPRSYSLFDGVTGKKIEKVICQ